ncbi:MAG TPA: IS200/IS605 family transposase [Bacteroidales bacterium]|nr:IS200/IS605 family transposase [Bacteroidales bacterium]
MLHTHSRIWIHLVWATKNRQRIIHKNEGLQLFEFFIDKGKSLDIPFEKLNIQPEHVHVLIDLPTNKMLSEFMHTIKGSSSHILNKEVFKTKFEWQRGYGAYSVSASRIEAIRKYIDNQHVHHQETTFEEEYQQWIKEYGLFDD